MANQYENKAGVYPDGRLDGVRFAERIGVPHGTVKRWLSEGLPCRRRGHRVLINADEATAWVKARYPASISFNRRSVVYFARRDSDGAIKIGFTSDIERRLKELRRDTRSSVHVLACFPGSKPNELALHRRFSCDRIDDEDEWFRPSNELLAFVTGLGGQAA